MGADGVQSGTLTMVSSPPTQFPSIVSQEATSVTATLSSDFSARGIQFGTQWSGSIRYSFTTSPSNYESHYSDAGIYNGYSPVTATQALAVRDILGNGLSGPTYFAYGSLSSLTNAAISEIANTAGLVNTAEIRIADTLATSTAYAYFPSNDYHGGDVWFGRSTGANLSPVVGSYGWMTHIHELGHALGLKHSHTSSQYIATLVPSSSDDIEFTVMSYRSFINAPLAGYTNETYGYAQTFMMYDIAALQAMYGADFGTNSTDTRYQWDPSTGTMYLNGASQGTPGANRIFLTTWDGGGNDTYDLSNYSTNLQIDLAPGGWSKFSDSQTARLDTYYGTGSLARGNVYNALLYNGDVRSYIENATGGSGNDTINGNVVDNVLVGGAGADTLRGYQGNDTLDGGTGADFMYGGAGDDVYVVDNMNDFVSEQFGEGTDTVLSSAGFVALSDDIENLTLVAGAGWISGIGNALDNVLIGNESRNDFSGLGGNDTLDGRAGADVLNGGTGNDTYVVDNVGDVVTELAGEGTDTVRSSISYVLGANLENLILAGGAGSIDGTGNSLANAITGNEANNRLDGGTGADSMTSGAGNDSYVVDNAGDVATELAGEGTDVVVSSLTYTLGANLENLTLASGAGQINGTGTDLANLITGNEGANALVGLGGDDALDGGLGVDTMAGGTGNDSYVVDNASDVIVELAGEGVDTVQSRVTYALGADVENLVLVSGAGSINGTGTNLANVITGNEGVNTLIGLQGDDSLNGGAGADTMVGGTGNDSYVVDGAGDVIVELAGEGTDTVAASIGYTLSASIENLILSVGAGSIDGTGNASANTIVGNEGANVLTGLGGDDSLNGGTGADTMLGGADNDSYVVDNAGDVIVELVGEGTDTAVSSTSYALGANVENLTLASSAGSIAGTGNTLANVLLGNQGNNTLSGLDGNDTLNGGAGSDVIDGGAGLDTAIFAGLRSDYQVIWDYDVVQFVRSGETDALHNVEQVSFSDGLVSVNSFGPAPVIVEVAGATQLTNIGIRSYLRDADGAGPALKYQGAAVVAGQFGAGWTAIGAEQVGSGYQVAFKNGTQDQYAVWNVDGNGNMLDLPAGILSGASATLQNLETMFQQDLNGNGQIGLTTTTIETFGTTRLIESGGQFFLRDPGGAGPSLKYQGGAVVSGQFGAWTVIGAEQVGGGYQIAFKNGTQDQYAVWTVDGSGNMLSLPAGVLSGASATLQNLETTFQQDLNGNGQIGLAPVTIESFGATRLVESGGEFFLRDTGGAGPSLKYQGGVVVAGQFGAWTVIGAEQVGGGYRGAFKNGTQDQYAVWTVDGSGNMTSLPAGVLSGASATLQNLEATFQQDLNGNGQIGLVPVTIETFGVTRLVESGGEFFLRDAAGAGPSLKYLGGAVVSGQFGAWVAIGAEQVGSGYQVAFKNGIQNQYAVWTVDGSGNMVDLTAGVLSGASATLQNLETTFQQDLNGNGQIGLVPVTIETFGATRLVESGGEFFLRDAGGAGPSLKYQGAAFVAGQFGDWTVIGAEQTAGGYQAAWKNGGANQYVVWNLDGNGNYVDNATGFVPGSDMSLQLLEAAFQQDLNGNGQIGPTTTTIESFGATRLVESGGQLFLRDAGGAGPSLKYQGAAFTEGQFEAWAAIGAEQSVGGYMAAFKNGAADQYVIWNLDGGGNYVGNATGVVAGSDMSLQALETAFQQDLNGNGQIGSPSGSGIEELAATSVDDLSISRCQAMLLPEPADTLSLLLTTLRQDV